MKEDAVVVVDFNPQRITVVFAVSPYYPGFNFLQDAQRGPGFFKGDDDLMVDRLVSVCAAQKKGDSVLLPGFGRDLVPYFVPGTAEPGESEINATLVQKPESRPGSQTSSPSRTSQSTSNLDKRPKRQASKQLRVAPRKLEGDSLGNFEGTFCELPC